MTKPAAPIDFDDAFEKLTGYPPFPWQRELYRRLTSGKRPKSCLIPTGLGKTAILAIWLIAFSNHPDRIARRLVYVVNRRTVVDQTTTEAENLQARSESAGVKTPAISTLRGQFADNREWSSDPSRPAIIVGTVDMIGSRLLFSGYGVGFKARPLHAGFLGQDSLLIHDEAHLEPAFQSLVEAICTEQKRCKEFARFDVIELTATGRGSDDTFELTPEELAVPNQLPATPTKSIHHVWLRISSKKGLKFHTAARAEIAKRIGEIARDRWSSSNRAILVFVRTIDDIAAVQAVLTDEKNGGVPSDQVQVLTGTQRGLERDRLADEDRVFARFMPKPKVLPKEGTVYLVCTSAGEVGVDISADHMVCDLTTLDSMAQRLGRVNRRGEGAAEIDVLYESEKNPKPAAPDFDAARWNTLEVLRSLPHCNWTEGRLDASPGALGRTMRALTDEMRTAAFAPTPTRLPVTDILFDAWTLTTVREKLPGRPPVEPYLHGLPTAWQPPETHVAWRQDVSELPRLFDSDASQREIEKLAGEWIEDYPLKPHELLRDNTSRVFDRLKKMKVDPATPAWLLFDDGSVQVTAIGAITAADKDQLNYATLVLPPLAGGLNAQGMLDEKIDTSVQEVADEWYADKEKTQPYRVRHWEEASGVKSPPGMRLIRRVNFSSPEDDGNGACAVWSWYEKENEGGRSAQRPVLWSVHVSDVIGNTERLVAALPLEEPLRKAIVLAARFHDHGKRRKVFQNVLGNRNYPKTVLAKSGADVGRFAETYRHEFGSLIDLVDDTQEHRPEFDSLSEGMRELVLHLIAAHHGRARPHFPIEEAFDPERSEAAAEEMAAMVPQRFGRLQRKYGRWGLAYLESLLRAADWAASANPSTFAEEGN